MPQPPLLTIKDHDRATAGLTYVYPVVSRRAGGVSVGVNLNPNNACNWACAYCQVPNLKRGAAPVIDLTKLEAELRGFLHQVLQGDFMQAHVPAEARRLNDIALSGNGEPTSAREFDRVVALIGTVMRELDLVGRIKLVLITNGSLMQRETVQNGLRQMAQLNGEVWFKVDSATKAGMLRINHTRRSIDSVCENLRIATALCPTWLQTCMFQMDGHPPTDQDRTAYLDFLASLATAGINIQGVLLYGLARPSLQPEAPRLSALPKIWLDAMASDIAALGISVKLTE